MGGREVRERVYIMDPETLGSSLLQSGLQGLFCCFERGIMIVADIYCMFIPQIMR